MNSTGKLLVGLGAVGVAAGIGYWLWRYMKSKREQAEATKATADPEGTKTESTKTESTKTEGTKTESVTAEGTTTDAAPTATPRPTIDPLPGPATPLERPRDALAYLRINWSDVDDQGTVTESAEELLEQARKYDSSITLNELTGARLAASEHHRGSLTELACIVDAELNRADRRGMSLFESLTHERTFGKQGRKRRASTRQDPKMIHLWAARAVLSGQARGVSRGADRFFDPKAMDRMHDKYRKWLESGKQGKQPPIVSCDAVTLLEAWSFDYGKQGESRCPSDRDQRGRDTLAWVGPIPGVDPLRLMLMKRLPIGTVHTRHYEAAREVLRAGLTSDA